MKLDEILYKRCLIRQATSWGGGNIIEVKILEISPTKNWVKLMNTHGNKYWRASAELDLVEVLIDLKDGKPKL